MDTRRCGGVCDSECHGGCGLAAAVRALRPCEARWVCVKGVGRCGAVSVGCVGGVGVAAVKAGWLLSIRSAAISGLQLVALL